MNENVILFDNVVELSKVRQPKKSFYYEVLRHDRFYAIEPCGILTNTPKYFGMLGQIVAPDVTDFVFSEHEVDIQKDMLVGNHIEGSTLICIVQRSILNASANEAINASLNLGKIKLDDLYFKINLSHLRLTDYDV